MVVAHSRCGFGHRYCLLQLFSVESFASDVRRYWLWGYYLWGYFLWGYYLCGDLTGYCTTSTIGDAVAAVQ